MHNIKTNYIVTSHYSERLELEISDRYLILISIPWYSCFDEFVVEIQDSIGKIHIHRTIKRSTAQLDISVLRKGKYFANIFMANKCTSSKTESLLYKNIMIDVEDTEKCFVLPIHVEDNKSFINRIPISKNDLLRYTLSTKNIECHKPEIYDLAQEICLFSHNDYNRLLCIHDWISENLYYDMDSYNSGDYTINIHKAVDAIKCDKKCVCSDFTFLTVALARSLKIPSLCITCDTDNKRNRWISCSDNIIKEDHIFAASFVDNRWILMDNTWDCNNQILNGIFYKRTQGYNRKYFDVSIEILSSTHQFLDIYV